MATTRHKNPRTAMHYTKPGGEAVAESTGATATHPLTGVCDTQGDQA